VTFGGGYAADPADTVDIHVGTCRAALAAAARGVDGRGARA
jgi:hypothetical protein